MAVNIPGIISVAVFYVVILVIGIWAGRKTRTSSSFVEVLLANRDIGTVVFLFTITATWLGGGYINGTAEIIALQGLAWTQAPIGYSFALVICGYFFCPKMRNSKYVTMFDPFQEKYGPRIGALMCIPQFFGDLFWSAAILSALGATVHIVLDLEETLSIIVSAVIAILYTFLGGLWSVAYTDVIQLICVAVGLIVSCPFIMTHPSVDLTTIKDKWVGEVDVAHIGAYIDVFMLLTFGGTTWQEIFQRTLACRNAEQARICTMLGGLFCFLLSIPPAAIGIAGAAADWNLTSYEGEVPIPADKMGFILPLALQYLCPLPVSLIGLGAVSAAVMSSTDSSILVTASVFTKNIYKGLIRTNASEREMIWVMRVAIIFTGAAATSLAVLGKSIYGLFILCADLMYVILFPQFVCVLYLDVTNAYGSLLGFITGFVLRLGAGEPLIDLPSSIRFPFYSETEGQLFPFRTFTVAVTFVILYAVSMATNLLFAKNIIPKKYDVLKCSREDRSKVKIAMDAEIDEAIPLSNEPEVSQLKKEQTLQE